MQGFIIFIAVLVVIWTLSAIATAVNKQKDAERRRMLRDQMARAGIRTPEPVPQPPQRRPVQRPQAISRGIAERFPDVLLPPAPMKPRPQAQRRPQPIRHPGAPRPIAKPVRRQAPPPPLPVQELDEATPARLVAENAPADAPPQVVRRGTTPRINATTLSAWLKP